MNFDALPKIVIGKFTWWGTNHRELIGIKNEIFTQSIYSADLTLKTQDSPLVIIDAGAHVGLATLYFKLHYPKSSIICVEPHPQLIQILKHNLWFNRLDGVEVIESALSDHIGTQTLYTDDSEDMWLSTTGKSGAWDQRQTTSPITVAAITLDELIHQPIDLLKMDIEGFELSVLQSSRKLNLIRQMIIELHPPITPAQIHKVLSHTHNSEITKLHFGLKLVRALGFEPRTKTCISR